VKTKVERIDNVEWIGEEWLRAKTAAINAAAKTRIELAARYGQTWDTAELKRDFEVKEFGAPFVVVTRRSDGARGSLMFQHEPRVYWGFVRYDP
jgi:hypothetical protein